MKIMKHNTKSSLFLSLSLFSLGLARGGGGLWEILSFAWFLVLNSDFGSWNHKKDYFLLFLIIPKKKILIKRRKYCFFGDWSWVFCPFGECLGVFSSFTVSLFLFLFRSATAKFIKRRYSHTSLLHLLMYYYHCYIHSN